MMKFMSPLRKKAAHSSVSWHESQEVIGVRYAVRKVSLGRRIELAERVRELCLKQEFLKAGDASDQLDSSLADLLVLKLYIEWGLAEIQGLRIDGQDVTLELLVQEGPECLTNEIVGDIKSQLGLTEDERKNS